jgi:hypothetical protein
MTKPLISYYAERRILLTVDTEQRPDSVTGDIQVRLSGLRLISSPVREVAHEQEPDDGSGTRQWAGQTESPG